LGSTRCIKKIRHRPWSGDASKAAVNFLSRASDFLQTNSEFQELSDAVMRVEQHRKSRSEETSMPISSQSSWSAGVDLASGLNVKLQQNQIFDREKKRSHLLMHEN
jgi:hypothetical protein